MAKRWDAVELLEEDHAHIRQLLDRLAHTSERGVKSRERIIEDIHRELEIHTAIEEEIFYPAFRDAAADHASEEMYFEFLEEHFLAGEVEAARALDTDPGSVEFTARCTVLKELVTHHIEEEEERMLSAARELFDDDERMALGERMANRKRELTRELKKAA